MVLGSYPTQRQPRRQLRPSLGVANKLQSLASVGRRPLGNTIVCRLARRSNERYDDEGREEEPEEEDEEEYEYDEGEEYEDTLDRYTPTKCLM